MIFFIYQYLNCEIIFTMHISQQQNREYFVPQNRHMNSPFHSDAKLLLVTWYPLTNHIIIFMKHRPIMSLRRFRAFSLFTPFLFLRIFSDFFPSKGLKIPHWPGVVPRPIPGTQWVHIPQLPSYRTQLTV